MPIQCDMKSCWCVDVHYGNEIAGSRISKAMRRADMCRGENGKLTLFFERMPKCWVLQNFACASIDARTTARTDSSWTNMAVRPLDANAERFAIESSKQAISTASF